MLDALGNLGDFVGGVAVVVTLIYLATQVRQNTQQIALNTAAVKAAAYSAELEVSRQQNMQVVLNRELAGWTLISQEEVEQLDPVDRVRLDLFLMITLRHRQHLFVQTQEGLVRQDLLATHDAGLRALFPNPVLQDPWARRKHQFVSGLVSHVDALLSDRPTA